MSPSEKTDARDPSGGAGRSASAAASGGTPSAPAAGPPTAAARPNGQRPASGTTRPTSVGGGAGTLGNGPRPAAAGAAQRGTTGRPLTSPPASAAAPTAPVTTARQAPAAAQASAPTAVRPARTGSDARTSEPAEPGHVAAAPAGEAPRRVKLSLSRVSLWSVARLAFLLSVALGIIVVVAVTVLWAVLDGMGVFTQLDSVISDVVGTESNFRVAELLSLPRVLSVTVFLAVVDVVLLTLISTIAAVLYNLASGLVGGVRLTLSDD